MHITDQQQIKTYYKALLNRDASYLGSFIVGVKTTNIFCIATCRARKPKFENVEFFSEIKDALNAGYRPCKVCKPTANNQETPEDVQQAIQLVQDNPKQKVTDYQLRQQNLSPENLRRWFKKHYGITFQTYQRMFRVNTAFEELQSGKTTTETALDSGYDSLSGFGYTFKKVLGKSPKQAHEQQTILISRVGTPIGPMFVCATNKGVCLLEFVDRRMLETEFKDLQKRLNAHIVIGENEHSCQAKREINEYFQGKRKHFEVSLDTPGTEFQQQVWEILQHIPYGETHSYQQQAQAINNPKAVRAVASANGMNRVAIITPCHRVIGKDGSLTGYGGGLERKRWLLEHESKNVI
ncbi:methylated-DNA--[protein]-cysteine S-methyltransferase [Parashewanella curva]|uniref:Methylated-DNA--protein-cysteine methyltransferase n=1 Tax=Parashewanella curva TaxID=2338552 RepID=A0A3L8Q1C5_9GAMM|nr:methylated-DNA--[protein]-cysteine S-methyltransferase [Parashewanella curva]RLV61446.1 methylated-DNA--[protein]-cysteine S-methyltransferase [Parashewanella curva]